MKIAYIYHINNKYSYAAKTIATGFANAFTDRGESFKFFDITKLEKRAFSFEAIKLLNYGPDIIFTSAENIPHLPLALLKSTALVLWAPFYEPCDYEAQIHSISDSNKQLLNKYSTKHNIVVWSQHDDQINDRYFSGYEKELGLKLIQLLHCADKTRYTEPSANPEFDFLWVGNIGHRASTFESLIEPMKKTFGNHLVYTEHNMIDPQKIEAERLYTRSFVTPNVHSEAQVKHRILLNERTFTASMLGGFQICDNPLIRKYFSETELALASTSSDFIEKTHYYIKHPQERLQMIKKMQRNVLDNHTYFNRIDTVLSALGMTSKP